MIFSNFSNKFTHLLAMSSFPTRRLALIATIAIPLITAIKINSAIWSIILTATGTLLGIYSVWLTLEIFHIGDKLSQQQNRLIEEVHRSVMVGLKINSYHELRRKYMDVEDDSAKTYWHFIWRFETYNFLSLSLLPGHARIKIVGCIDLFISIAI